MIQEVKAKGKAFLSGLSAEDSAHAGAGLTPAFHPGVTDYTLRVQSDIYGVKVIPRAEGARSITVNGAAVKSGEGVVVPLSEAVEDYGKDLSADAEITVTGENGDTKTYTIHILRENAAALYAKFRAETYRDGETGLDMPYALYVPEEYDPRRKYPLVFFLHGAGQRTQDLSMVLKRYEGATVWVKEGRECIVLAPQCTDKITGWTGVMNGGPTALNGPEPFRLSRYGQAAYRLLQKVKAAYSIDTGRIYLTGISMGGFAAFAMAIAHPDEFAALLSICGGADPKAVSALKNIPLRIFHALCDPIVDFQKFGRPTLDALDQAGISYRATIYGEDTFFYPNGHFSWTPAYADQKTRDWLFAQRKGK